MDNTELARIAYNAYRNHTGGVSLATGRPIPEWEHLRSDIQAAWMASAEAVRKEFDWRPISQATDEQASRYHRQFVGKWRITGTWCVLATDIPAALAMEYTHFIPQPTPPAKEGK